MSFPTYYCTSESLFAIFLKDQLGSVNQNKVVPCEDKINEAGLVLTTPLHFNACFQLKVR